MKTLSSLNIPIRNSDPSPPESGIEIYSINGIVYSIDSSGLIEVLTNIQSGGGGGNDHVDLAFDAAEPILAFKLVTLNESGHVIYASSDNLNHVNRVLGVSKNAAAVGHKVNIRNTGVLINTGWQWTPQQLLYLGINGEITSNPNTGLFSNNIGYALNQTTIFVNISRSIIRG